MAKSKRSAKPVRSIAKSKGSPGRTARKAGKSARAAKAAAPAKRARAVVIKPLDHAVASMVYAHDFVVKACNSFPDDRVTWQRHPEDNHPLWTLGHLAATYDWFATMLDGQPSRMSEAQNKLFGYESKPVNDVEAYPSMPEVRRLCDDAWKRLLKAAKAMTDADLGKPPHGKPSSFAPDRLTALERCTWHDGWHAGQVSTLRRALGLPSLMGG